VQIRRETEDVELSNKPSGTTPPPALNVPGDTFPRCRQPHAVSTVRIAVEDPTPGLVRRSTGSGKAVLCSASPPWPCVTKD
jgi:hypothetical protein